MPRSWFFIHFTLRISPVFLSVTDSYAHASKSSYKEAGLEHRNCSPRIYESRHRLHTWHHVVCGLDQVVWANGKICGGLGQLHLKVTGKIVLFANQWFRFDCTVCKSVISFFCTEAKTTYLCNAVLERIPVFSQGTQQPGTSVTCSRSSRAKRLRS